MIKCKTTDLICIQGIRGSGKTTLAKALSKMYQKIGVKRFFVIDPMREFHEFPGVQCYDLQQCVTAVTQTGENVIFSSAPEEEIEDFLDLIKELDNFFLIYDEADMLLRSHHNCDAIKWLIHYGRHTNTGMLLISRRPQELPRAFTAQSYLFFNNCQEGTDKKYLRQRLGYNPFKKFSRLEKYCWYLSTPDGEIYHVDRGQISTLIKEI